MHEVRMNMQGKVHENAPKMLVTCIGARNVHENDKNKAERSSSLLYNKVLSTGHEPGPGQAVA